MAAVPRNPRIITPKAVVFDLGKVLLEFDYGISVRRLQKHCRLSEKELQALINQSPLLYRYETNLISTAQFFTEIRTSSGFCGDFKQFRELFSDIFTPIAPMVELHAHLHARGVPTYIFSNTNELAIDHIRAQFPFFSNFDGYILSYEHNLMKPDPQLYRIVERTAGLSGPELLYIDDRSENVATGQQLGWQIILHHTPELTRAAVLATGVLC